MNYTIKIEKPMEKEWIKLLIQRNLPRASELYHENEEIYEKVVNYIRTSKKPMCKEWITLWGLINTWRESALYCKIGETFRKRVN